MRFLGGRSQKKNLGNDKGYRINSLLSTARRTIQTSAASVKITALSGPRPRLLLAGGTDWGWVELLGGHHSSRALGVFVLELGVDLFGQLGLAFVLVEFGELKLGEAAGDRRGGLGGELVVEIDGLLIAASLAVELRQGEFGE